MKSKGFDALSNLKVRAFEEDEEARLERQARELRAKEEKAVFDAELKRLGMLNPKGAEADKDLFAQEMAKLGVTRLDGKNTPHPGATKRPKTAPIPAAKRARAEMNLSDNFDATAMDDWADRDYVAIGSSVDLTPKLKRGLWPVSAHLDLHGYTIDEARSALSAFIVAAHDEGLRCVRVVHGKGMNSDEGPVLKMMVRRWLRQMDSVLAYIQAQPGEGGSGAVRVLLAKKILR